MPGHTVEAEEIKVPISKRFVDKKGNVIPFVFKPITTERIDELEKENTTYKNIKGRGRVKDLDTQRFYARIAIESTIYPDFRSKELREAYQTADPVEVAKRVLSVGGEYANWLNKAIEINGFEDDLEDLEEEAKLIKDGNKEAVYLYFAMHELHYSPSQLRELYEAPKPFKAFLYGLISYKLQILEKEARKGGT